jgi:RNA polymerase sigma factor (sigma-70 family)
MASNGFKPVIRYLRKVARGKAEQLTDRALLDCYIDDRDEEAFALLVERHGGLVLGVCRRVVHDWHAAEDCFQAVFLVLATKAHLLPKHETLGAWLHAVAIKVALKSNARAAIRRIRECKAARSIVEFPADSVEWHDLRLHLDDAVARLESKYRIPFVLCYLQGKSVSAIAQQLGQPKGTVASRLARAREHLRARLIRQEITLSDAGLLTALSQCALAAAVPQSLVSATIESALLLSAGHAAACLIPNLITPLMEGAMRTFMIANLKLVAGVLVASTLGLTFVGYHTLVAVRSGGKVTGADGTTREATNSQPIGDHPVNRRPADLKAPGQRELQNISLSLLRRTPIGVYRLGPGDTLGIVVDGVIGNSQEFIPVTQGEKPDDPSGIGYPILVREDGTISLPETPPITVTGMSISEVEKALKVAYTIEQKVVNPAKFGAIVTLLRKRTAKVLVIRQDAGINAAISNGTFSEEKLATDALKRGTGQLLELPIGDNDLLTALTKTGGIPGGYAVDDVVIERIRPAPVQTSDAKADAAGNDSAKFPAGNSKQKIHIPLRLRANDPITFAEDDITLQSGDVVFVALRK